MKQNALFFIKSLLLGTLGSAIGGGILMGLDEVISNNTHPHQMMPGWMVGIMFGIMIGAIAGIILSIVMILIKKTNLKTHALITTLITVGIILSWLVIGWTA